MREAVAKDVTEEGYLSWGPSWGAGRVCSRERQQQIQAGKDRNRSIYFNCKYSSRRHTKVRATPKTIFSEKDLKTSWTALAQQGAEKSYQDELREPEIHSFQHPTPSSEGRGLLELFVGTDMQAGAILHSTYVASSFHGVQFWHSSPSTLLTSLALPQCVTVPCPELPDVAQRLSQPWHSSMA